MKLILNFLLMVIVVAIVAALVWYTSPQLDQIIKAPIQHGRTR